MRNRQTNLRRVVVAVALLAVLWSWSGVPLVAADGEPGPGQLASDRSGSLVAAVTGWLAQWLDLAPGPDLRSFSAPGGAGMDPNGSPEEADEGDDPQTGGSPTVEAEGGAGLDPNG